MHASYRLLLVLCCVLLPILVGTRPAGADDWSDAKKAFRKAQRADDIQSRRDAFIDLLNFDGTEQTVDAVEEIFKALAKEESPAVILAGIEALSTFVTDEATAAIAGVLEKGRGSRRLHALLALADKPTGGGEDILLEILQGKEEPLVAQAALALGRKQVEKALPYLYALLEHDTWQIRAAAARGVERMAGGPVKDPKTGEESLPPLPAWLDSGKAIQVLAQSLETAEGRARGDVISALERISQQDFGYDIEAWKRLAAGEEASTIHARPARVPHIFGIPIYGRKVVILIDISTCTDDTHPFRDLRRLKEVLRVPGGRPAALPTIRTTKDFYGAHAKRLIKDLPTRGYRFDVIAVFQTTEPVFDRLTPVNSGTKRKAIRFIDELSVQNGPNHYLALNEALDISGTKDSVAWSLGPDEIVLMTCAIPWAPKDPNAMVGQSEVGAAIGLKARMRMVPIHTVGVGPHPFGMMQVISSQSGGTYVDLSK